MSAPERKSLPALPLSKQEDCLRELKDAGATPEHMIKYSWRNFTIPSMFRSLMWATVILGTAYAGVLSK